MRNKVTSLALKGKDGTEPCWMCPSTAKVLEPISARLELWAGFIKATRAWIVCQAWNEYKQDEYKELTPRLEYIFFLTKKGLRLYLAWYDHVNLDTVAWYYHLRYLIVIYFLLFAAFWVRILFWCCFPILIKIALLFVVDEVLYLQRLSLRDQGRASTLSIDRLNQFWHHLHLLLLDF